MSPIPASLPIATRRLRVGRAVADRRGAAMLEFALVAVPLMALLIATIETALISFTQQAIETAAESAARSITTGAVQAAHMTQQQFHDSACTTLPTYLSCSKLMVDVQKTTSFSAVSTAPPTISYDSNGNPTNTFAFAAGGAGDIVVVRLMYLWPVSVGGFGLGLNNAGRNTRMIIATNVAKTEPYTS